jgi:MoaA/NifB/PqqE/SkfB family radical SAM enzyme
MKHTALPHQQEPDTAANPALYSHPSRLFVDVATRCNLQCPMRSKQSPGNMIADGEMSADTFARIVPAFSRLEALILNGIGEPLLQHSSLFRCLQ